MEREAIKDKLTKYHLDEYMYDDESDTMRKKETEVQANYIKMCLRPEKPTRRAIHTKKLYEEMTRKVLIEHELKLKEENACGSQRNASEYMDGYAHSSWVPIDLTKHQIYPLYKKDDAITFWTHNPSANYHASHKPPTIRKITRFSKPIGEQLDTQFH